MKLGISSWITPLLVLLCSFKRLNARSPTPWLFKFLAKPVQAAKEELTQQINQNLNPFVASGKRLRRNQFLFQAGSESSEVLFVPHDDIMNAGNSASYFLCMSGIWAGRVANDDDSFIGIKSDNTNWNVGGIGGFQWDVQSTSPCRLQITLRDTNEIDWTIDLSLKDGYNQLRTAIEDFEPIQNGKLIKNTNASQKTEGRKPKVVSYPGTIQSLTIKYTKVDNRMRRNRRFKPGDFRLKLESIKNY